MTTAILAAAREYWDVLNSTPDGWGQHVHPRYGASHWMLLALSQKYGADAFADALEATRPKADA